MTKRSFLLFVYSTANIVACFAACLGLAAFFGGLIKNYWPFIVFGLYALGYLLTPKNHASQHQLSKNLSKQELQKKLEELVKKTGKRLPHKVQNQINSIKSNINQLLPHLEALDASGYDIHIVRQTVLDYLPEMLATYLGLPPAFAKMHKIRAGKTAEDILIEQLSLLDEQLQRIVISVNSQDAEALVIQGQFLKDKFKGSEKFV